MQIDDIQFGIVRWESQRAVMQPGKNGHATVKTVRLGDICLRHIEFTAGYCADDWCSKGHIGVVLSGVLSIAVKDGGTMEISAGDSFYLGDHQDLHRAASAQGAIVFVID